MPKYRCHKEVWALKIEDVVNPSVGDNESDGSLLLEFVDHHYESIRVGHEFVRRHKPKAGDYYVVYADGYDSISPAAPFESGYTRI